MSSSDKRIPTTGRIVEDLGNGCYRAELPNGKIVLAYPGKTLRRDPDRTLETGTLVSLDLTPYDFSKAEISGLEN